MPWTPTDDFSVAFLTNPKDFLEARGLWQTTAAAGLKGSRQGLTRAWSWSRATSLPFRCSSSPLSVAESFRLAPTVVCGSWGAWMYGHKSLSGSPGGGALAPLAALALQKANLPGREGGREEACASSLVSEGAAKAPEQWLCVNSFVFWQFCTITSHLYRLGQATSASVSSLGSLSLSLS